MYDSLPSRDRLILDEPRRLRRIATGRATTHTNAPDCCLLKGAFHSVAEPLSLRAPSDPNWIDSTPVQRFQSCTGAFLVLCDQRREHIANRWAQ